MTIENPRILLIDSYDSFSYNLAALCHQAIPGCRIHIIKNDELEHTSLIPLLKYFSAVIVGPGPGSPEIASDIGVVRYLWNADHHNLIPIFGVCLGLQSLGIAYGAQLKRLKVVKHGQISYIHHTGSELFQGVGRVEAVRYHSLHVVPVKGGDVEELAWADDVAENGRVVMALGHVSKPFWAVQYHPESVRTQGGGVEVIQNFWRLAQSWTRTHERRVMPWHNTLGKVIGNPWRLAVFPSSPPVLPSSHSKISTTILELPNMATATVCELLGAFDEESPFVSLDSAAEPGRYSIVGSLMQSSLQITHFVGDSFISLIRGKHHMQESLGDRDVWAWLGAFMATRKACQGHPDIPFWGGLIGILSYELGVHSLGVCLDRQTQEQRHPDLNVIFVERSVVIDSKTGRVFVQSLIPDDSWIQDTARILRNAPSQSVSLNLKASEITAVVKLPDKSRYITRIKAAKERIFAGDSYELCLTARTSISLPKVLSVSGSASWRRFQTLRSKNPAPYSAYIRLHPTTLLSSSPERFLSTSRPPNPVFQLRPIKGTVRKAPGITREVAEEALVGSAKEVAENLMIVDLIRHDLHAVVGEDVQVKQFCGVEEYETVWQLVSVIEGRPEAGTYDASNPDTQLGWEMLKRSLPPGSMTGAPKKRSVEILQTLEDQERGIYSGVFGYWCIGGGSDWSVTIRSCFKFEDNTKAENGCSKDSTETWNIGAGGAITALSDADAEWEEMVVKLQSVVGAFTSCI